MVMAHQQQDNHDDQEQAYNAARSMTPTPTPGEGAKEKHDQQDQQNG